MLCFEDTQVTDDTVELWSGTDGTRTAFLRCRDLGDRRLWELIDRKGLPVCDPQYDLPGTQLGAPLQWAERQLERRRGKKKRLPLDD